MLSTVSVSRVLVGGSRVLTPSASLAVRAVVRALAPVRPLSFACGCSTGADAAFLIALCQSGAAARLRVFAAFGSSGEGALTSSAVSAVVVAGRAGAAVRYNAGGGIEVPPRARLVKRTAAAVAASSAGVFVLSEPESRGSLLAVRALWRRGCPALVLPTCAVLPLPLPECSNGEWVEDFGASLLFGWLTVRWEGERDTPIL